MMFVHAGRGLPRDRELANLMIVDRWGFVITVVVGAFGILAGKSMDLPQWQVTAFAVATILLYALVLAISPRFSLREDQAGDNLYYVGLLLTLTSLGWALYAFDESGGARQIVQSFGMALATTVVGLALRVWFNQMRQNLVQIEKESRIELAEAAGALRAELIQTVVSMNDFRRLIQQAIAEAFVEMEGLVRASAEGLAKDLGKTGEDVGERLATAFDRLEQHALRFDGAAARMAQSVEAHAGTLERVSQTSAAADAALSGLVKSIGAADREVSALAQRMTTLTDAREHLAKALQSTGQAIVAQTETAERLRSAVDILDAQVRAAATRWEATMGSAVCRFADARSQSSSPLIQALSSALRALKRTLKAVAKRLRAGWSKPHAASGAGRGA